ncbi:transmembrane protein 160 [Nematolebias whitei]|uniref:transmembrane protein 160 n=1 Tax=Nematolebias whitei TaxID=451745 RepID=UPI001899C4CC|nr:transmembrane protein 160 [Nematolebias whitei]
MAFLTLFMRRRLPRTASLLGRLAEPLGRSARAGAPVLRRLHDWARLRAGEKPGPWCKNRAPELQYQLTDLDKADALMLRKSHETGYLSWFRNGLLATGIGVIAHTQSERGLEASYAFIFLGGICVMLGSASYVGSLFTLRRLMLISVPAALLQGAVVGSIVLFWFSAMALYTGKLEMEIIHEDEEREEDERECRECRDRRQQRGYHGSQDGEESSSSSRGQNK